MMDKHKKGWVTGPELAESLAEFGSYPHKNDLHLFVRRYDRDSDGRLQYSDFCEAFAPKDHIAGANLGGRPAFHVSHGYCREHFFTKETRDCYLRTFRTHFACEESAELLRKRLSRRPNFNVHDAF